MINKTRYIPQGYTKDNITLYFEGREENLFEVYTNLADPKIPKAMFFTGKQSKPTWHYRFFNTSDMVKKIKETIDKVVSWEERKAENKKARKAPHTLKVGDILYSSWGYDQTNINFYQVTKVISDRTVEIRAIASNRVGGSVGTDEVIAVKDAFLAGSESDKRKQPMIKRVSKDNTIKISSYEYAWKWDGRPKSETAFGFGH